MIKNVPVILTADNRYARYCAVTIYSILENSHAPENFHFYILSPDMEDTNLERLTQLCNVFHSQLSIIPASLEIFQLLPNLQHLSLNTYLRICSPDLCKEHDYFLFLDCDLIVLADLIDLFEISLLGKPLGAVPHVQFPYQEIFKEKFKISSDDVCFNGGVMLIDAKAWRHHNFTEKVLQCAVENSDKLQFADQDALNKIFWQNYYHLPGQWNVEARLYKEKMLGLPQTDEITKRMQLPKIIHYTGSDKPWSSRNYVPKRESYLEYSDKLSDLIGWSAESEIRCCSPLRFISFVYSCVYFRLSLFING